MISSVVCRFFFMFRFWGLAPKPNILNGPILGGHLKCFMGESMSLLQKRYDQALTDLIDLLKDQRGGQAITNGTVVAITPPPGSPRARVRYIHTRKLNQKTSTTALSQDQFISIEKAIEKNRKVNNCLSILRDLAFQEIMSSSKGVKKRKRQRSGWVNL